MCGTEKEDEARDEARANGCVAEADERAEHLALACQIRDDQIRQHSGDVDCNVHPNVAAEEQCDGAWTIGLGVAESSTNVVGKHHEHLAETGCDGTAEEERAAAAVARRTAVAEDPDGGRNNEAHDGASGLNNGTARGGS
ncbi:Aste57867_1539 [Aphanomyces stellatus]|uniref:Aste57867_1539 protein n=1 Tax=Aphanomyces stellatus TaxID=120398 RepID=A0A485K5W9_9STRA|nr:hypothetical protein As57867_001538 [Aphanomyces stellatus]VFT78754.1 Aste57867_1539 [Aphanomyces stellatus]